MKSAITYSLHPLLILLELYLVAPIRQKRLIMLPYLINMALAVTDITGTCLIYGYHANGSFQGGPFHFLPAVVLCFYILILLHYSLSFLKQGDRSKALIVIFLAVSSIITIILEVGDIITNHTTELAAFEMMLYYFYLAAIHQSQMQNKLYESELELERQHNALLMAQIQLTAVKPANYSISSGVFDMNTVMHIVDYNGNMLNENGEWVKAG